MASLEVAKDAIHQLHLEKVLIQLFVGHNIISNSRKKSEIKNPDTGSYLEIDVWIPDLKIGFEFQDVYHYKSTWNSHATLDFIQNKDRMKQQLVESRGETLILVPCWWDGSLESLRDTIHFCRPDLGINNISTDISKDISNDSKVNVSVYTPLNPPRKYFKDEIIPDIGELMLASFPLSVNFNNISSSEPWWLGEKYDGIRVCWNPIQLKLYSRSGTTVEVTESIQNHLCSFSFFDGEIWFGRSTFAESQGLVFSNIHDINWSFLRVVSFDSPFPVHANLPFETRYETVLYDLPSYSIVVVASRLLCTASKLLRKLINLIIENDGEGIMLRKPGSWYESGRSASLLKLKASWRDREALVANRDHTGLMTLQLPEGTQFQALWKDEYGTAPNKGDVVSFGYERVSSHSEPIRPFNFRIRKDYSWQAVVADYLKGSKNEEVTVPKLERSRKKDKWQKLRLFLEDFARKHNFDPLVPENWYSFKQNPFKGIKQGGKLLMTHFRGNYAKALVRIFPEIGLELKKFSSVNWMNISRRRRFFESIGKQMGFDSLVPANWYSLSGENFSSLKHYRSVVSYHKGSHICALVELFPEIGFDENEFKVIPESYWFDTGNVRRFFDRFAARGNFDPLIPDNWYYITREEVSNLKGGRSILSLQENNLAACLAKAYPNVGLNESNFIDLPRTHWQKLDTQRSVFLSLAHKHGLDPLLAETWYSINPDLIYGAPGVRQILQFYQGNLITTLCNIFPDISLDKDKFVHSAPKHWNVHNRRAYFEKLARGLKFDPLIASNWYQLNLQLLQSAKGAVDVLRYYNGSITSALVHLFPDIGIDEAKFWSKSTTQLLNEFAAQKGFDPLIPENWTRLSMHDISPLKSVLDQYKGSLVAALETLYPHIKFDRSKFVLLRDYWKHTESRRNYFEKEARERGMDPLLPETWYSFELDGTNRGATEILSYYGGSFVKAITKLFPEIGLKRELFSIPKFYWNDIDNRRNFFIAFANANHFDPLQPENWYLVPRTRLIEAKGGRSVLSYYRESSVEALLHLFPSIGLIKERLVSRPRIYWQDKKERRNLFCEIAKRENLDPLKANDWYRMSKEVALKYKGAKSVLFFYQGNLARALMDLFPEMSLDKRKLV